MCKVMGRDFFLLQAAIREGRLKDFKGEPDLFCWTRSGKWFFAEAKRADPFTESEATWFRICQKVLGPDVDLRVYRLRPAG